jgi:MFS family permease
MTSDQPSSLISPGGGLFGFDISSMSGVLGTMAYKGYFGFPVSYRQGGITCAMPFGSLVGALASSFIADRWSRRVSLQVASVFWVFGSMSVQHLPQFPCRLLNPTSLQCASINIAMLCVGRVVAGICVGIASSICPVYQSEIAPKEIRGRVVSLQQWAITWGILIQYFIQYGASHVGGGSANPDQPTSAFRIPWGVQIVPAVILFFGMFFLPYSPRWLASKDRWEEAITTLAGLHGGGDVNHPKVLAEYKEIEEALRFEREEAISSYRQLAAPRMVKRVILGMSIQMWSQLCGMNVMMYYVVCVLPIPLHHISRTNDAQTLWKEPTLLPHFSQHPYNTSSMCFSLYPLSFILIDLVVAQHYSSDLSSWHCSSSS